MQSLVRMRVKGGMHHGTTDACTTLFSAFILYCGTLTWVKGLGLIGLDAIIAASLWWG